MRRRHLLGGSLAGLSGLIVSPALARKVTIGFLGGGSGTDPSTRRNIVEPFLDGLRERGRVVGPDLAIEFRWPEGRPERIPGLVAELLRLDPDVLVTVGPRPAIVVRDATRTIPVVAIFINDAVQMGLAESLARPGRNFTGVSSFGIELIAKRLELMQQLVPAARRVGILSNPVSAGPRAEFEAAVRPFEQSMGIQVVIVDATALEQFDAAFEAFSRQAVDGVLIVADATFYAHRARLAELCNKHRLPSIWGGRDYLEGGGLASYQSDIPHMFRRGAYLVDAVLRGAKPAETPFEQASKLELAVNLKGARALGITVPRALLAGRRRGARVSLIP